MRLSSRQAAVLMDTHESSIKRWCNAGDLACETTSGGHRRIRLDALRQFAQSQDMPVDFLAFGQDQEFAVAGLLQLRRGRVSPELQETVKGWLLDAQSYRMSALMRLARAFGIDLPILYDRLIGGVMRDVGESWAAGAFQVGEEHRISEAILDVLYGQQAIVERGLPVDAPSAVLGSIREEEHVTGAMMVRTLLTEAGWNVAYLGRNVPEEDFVLFQRKVDAPLVCISATISKAPETIIQVVNRILALGGDLSTFTVAVGGSGAKAAQRFSHTITKPGRVVFFESAAEFAEWARSFQLHHALVEDETH